MSTHWLGSNSKSRRILDAKLSLLMSIRRITTLSKEKKICKKKVKVEASDKCKISNAYDMIFKPGK